MQPLLLESRIPLENTIGRIDHMAADLGLGRLFVAELGNGTVDVVDLAGGRVVDRISGLNEPQGVGYAARGDILVVACGGDGTVRFFRGADFAPDGAIALGADADNVRIDQQSGYVIVGYGKGGLAIIDPMRRSRIADVPLPAHPEGFQLDGTGARGFVNLPDAGQIAVVSLKERRIDAAWRVPGVHANFPLAFDPSSGLVASVFRSPPRLVLLDSANGRVLAMLRACGDADDVFFDPRRGRIYVSCGAGAVFPWERDAKGYRPMTPTATRIGARTSLFIAELDRLFVAERAGAGTSTASIAVYRPISG